MIRRRVLLKAAMVCSLFLAFSGQACPPNGDNMMPAPIMTPQVTAGDGIVINGDVLSLDTGFTDGLYWKLDGNAGTTAGTNFLGTTDDQPLELHVNGTRALRLEPTTTGPNVIGGFSGNIVPGGIGGATISGGGEAGFPNQVTSNLGTVGGGRSNTAGGSHATVGGGVANTASGDGATIGGGEGNEAFDNHATIAGGENNNAGLDDGDAAAQDYATVGGGFNNKTEGRRSTIGGGANNEATGDRATISGGAFNNADRYATVGGGQVNNATGFSATIGGGASNDATDDYSTIAGGRGNEATGDYAAIGGGRDNRATALLAMVPGGFQCWADGFVSFAAGYNARANHDGAFVWTDTAGIPVPFGSTADDQFLIRSAGGVGINTEAPQGALHTQAANDDTPDLVLGGNDENDDNGLITSDPTLPSSDINFFSNGGVGFKLDANDDETNAIFVITDGDETPVFIVEENGDTNVVDLDASGIVTADSYEAENDLGATNTPAEGGVYSDNVVYAWAQVQGNGNVLASYGCTVSRTNTGNYSVTFKRQLPNGVSAVVTPQSVNDPVIATVNANQSGATVITRLFVTPNFVAADYGFYIQVVGRP